VELSLASVEMTFFFAGEENVAVEMTFSFLDDVLFSRGFVDS